MTELSGRLGALPELPVLICFGWYLAVMLHADSAAAAAAASS